MIPYSKFEEFMTLINKQQLERVLAQGYDPKFHHDRASIKYGRKFTKIDVGSSGKYMVDNETGEIFGIKGYGVVHRGHRYGTIDTINEWNWGYYTAFKISANVSEGSAAV